MANPTVPQIGNNIRPVPLAEGPTVIIPDDARIDESGWAKYAIETAFGSVEIQADNGDIIRCIGAAEALVAAGIVNVDWIVEGKKSWCVAFDEAGPDVRIGGRGRPKGIYINIDRYGCDRSEHRVILRQTIENKKTLARLRQVGKQRQPARVGPASGQADGLLARYPATACHIEGNVIYWPGSGRVPAALPS